MAENVYQRVTDQIVAALESGVSAWSRPWKVAAGASSPMPYNVASGAHYRGINTVMLWCAREANGFSTHQWGTYRQWQDKGAQVRKGSKSVLGVFFKRVDRVGTNEDGEETIRSGAIATAFNLFNRDQVDGYEPAEVVDMPEVERIARADAFFEATGAKVVHGDTRAYYVPSMDYIALPDISAFTAPVLYYSTRAHETVHWTGTKARCDRSLSGRFGDEAYAAEELIAELGAAFTCAHLNLDDTPRDDHAQYIASWIKVLKRDNRAIFTAASAAQKAVDYLIGLQAPVAADLPLAA
jgi:antirestriction protein ArdC